MDMNVGMIWDAILSIFVPAAIFIVRGLSIRLEKAEDLLARTREEYATKYELTTQMGQVMELMHRLEDKLDRVLGNRNG